VVIANLNRLTSAVDVELQFGEPGAPIQIDDVRVRDSDFNMGHNTTIPGAIQLVSNGTPGQIAFENVLFEGPFPNNNTTSLFWMGGGGNPIAFHSNNFADFFSGGVAGSPLFSAVPGLTKGLGVMTFEQAMLGNANGSVFDWSGGTGNAPYISIKDNGPTLSAGNGQQVWKAAIDSNGGFSLNHTILAPTQTLLGSNGVFSLCCGSYGVGSMTDGSLIYGAYALTGFDQDIFVLNDNNGNTLFHVNVGGGIEVGENVAPTGISALDFLWADSTAHRWKMNNNNGGADTVVGTATTDVLSNKSTSAGPLIGKVASGTVAMTTASITGPNCGSTVTVSASGVLATDVIVATDNAAPAVTTNGPLAIKAWPTTNNVNFAYCVQSGTFTPGAATLNWIVMR
jgi:hypothetical protein